MHWLFFLHKRGEVRDKHEKAEKDYMSGMKYKDIAEKYNVTINTVKSWKKRYEWDRKGCTQKEKSVHTKKRVVLEQRELEENGTKETLENDDLTPEQQMFCIYYIRTFNASQSYQKAYGSSYATAMVNGCRLLRNAKVKEELDRLKETKRQQIVAGEEDVVELQLRIAFGDIGDYVSFGMEEVPVMALYGPVQIKDEETGEKKTLTKQINVVRMNESDNIDTQLIQEVKQGRDGVSIKLADKQKAINWLSEYFLMHPQSKYKAEYEKRRMEKEGSRSEEYEDDGFIDALKGQISETFEDSEGIVEE